MTFVQLDQEGYRMGTLKSRVPQLLRERGLKPVDLVRGGFSVTVAYKLANGETNLRADTFAKVVEFFGLSSIAQVFEYTDRESNGA